MNSDCRKLVYQIFCFFVICVVFVTSLAVLTAKSKTWFASNAHVENDKMSISANSGLTLENSKLLKYNEDTEIVELIEFDPNNPYESTATFPNVSAELFKMNYYDTVFVEERSIYTPIMMQIPISNIASNNFKIEIQCSGDLFQRNEQNEFTEQFANELSNLFEIRCTLQDLSANFITQNGSYENGYDAMRTAFGVLKTKDEFNENVNVEGDITAETPYMGKTFVEYQKNSTQAGNRITGKNDTITFNFAFEEIPTQTTNVYVYLGYNRAIVKEYIFANNGVNDIITAESTKTNMISFNADIVSFTFE